MNEILKKELDKMLKPLEDFVCDNKYLSTCSIVNMKSNSLTFISKDRYLKYLFSENNRNIENVTIVVPVDFDYKEFSGRNFILDLEKRKIKLFYCYNVDLVFTLFHNKYCSFNRKMDEIDSSSDIHPYVSITDGMKIAFYKGEKIMFKHIGNVVIGKDVFIDANTVIHRARLDSTIIRDGVKIGSLNNIAHNTDIGEGTVISTNSSIGGSTKIGKNCWIGLGVMVKNGIEVCDNVVLGMGSIITKSIDEPGVYIGSPAKKIKDYDPETPGF